MKRSISLITALSLYLVVPAHAEDLEQAQQLLNTKECSGCNLSRIGLVYANLVGAELSRANLLQANLSRANLNGANLSGANLTGAILFNANLSGADLSDADLSGADLRGAILTGANLQGATVDQTNFLGAIGLPPEVATTVNLYNLGLAEAERGNYRGAIEYHTRLIEIEPNFANAFLARSIAYFRLGDRVRALGDAQQAEQLYQTQGNEQGQQTAFQLAEGIQAFQEATEEQRQDMEGGNGLGTNVLSLLGSLASLLLRFGLP
ncbi:MAG: hypothetical protein Kow00121_25370 [Elainellaceae cyanobacterium]